MLAIYDPEIENHRFAAPNKFYESLMLGKPVMMVKNTGMSQVVVENDLGVLIEYTAEGFREGLDSLSATACQRWQNKSCRIQNIHIAAAYQALQSC